MAGPLQEGYPRRQTPEPFKAGFETYLSTFTYRYGSPEMRSVWSQQRFWGNVRDVWLAVAEVQAEAGLVNQEQLDDLRSGQRNLSVERIFELERQTGHDVAGAIAEYSEASALGGEILHQGMTSEDVLSNAEIRQVHDGIDILRPKVVGVLEAFGEKIDRYKGLVCVGWTHLQAAEPTTVGYRFAKYGQDVLMDLQFLDYTKAVVKGKGIKGAVGTSASFDEILAETGLTPEEHERRIMQKLGIDYPLITDQTYPRKYLLNTAMALASIGQSLHRFGMDVQLLQSSSIDEVSEPRRRGQVGSSAMPHKKNPILSENICALTEEMAGMLVSGWTVPSFVTLERTLRDSAGKRRWLPEGFLIADEALMRAERIVRGLQIHESSIRTNLNKFGPYMVTEIILAKLSTSGMDRKLGHEILVAHAEQAVDEVRSGNPNPMKRLILEDSRITDLVPPTEIEQAFENVMQHVGDAPKRCTNFLEKDLYPAIERKME